MIKLWNKTAGYTPETKENEIYCFTYQTPDMIMPRTYAVPACDTKYMYGWVETHKGKIIGLISKHYDAEKDTDLVIIPHDTWGYVFNYWVNAIGNGYSPKKHKAWVAGEKLKRVMYTFQDKCWCVGNEKWRNRVLDGIYKDNVLTDTDNPRKPEAQDYPDERSRQVYFKKYGH